MRCYVSIILLAVCYSAMTSLAMTSQKYVQMTSSTGAKVCSTDPPSQVLQMFPGGEIRCGIKCLMSSACPYYQFKSILCEVYNMFPVNFETLDNCLGFRPGLPSIVPQDCADIQKTISNVSGVYTVFVGSNYRPLTVYCDMNTTSGGWMVFQRRSDGSVDFYRNWFNYTQGFGDVKGEFWIGNENLNMLTTAKRYKLRIDLADFRGETRYAEYNNFVVQSSADNYRLLSIGTYSGTAGDSLGYHSGREFSTFDRNNSPCKPGNCGPSPVGNCAVTFRGAWWYGACLYSNLNGFFYNGSHTSWADGVGWYSWTDLYYSLKSSMKIKPFN